MVGRNDATDKEIGARLKEARKAAGLSQAQAAKLLQFTPEQLSNIEAGKRSVKAYELVSFSDVYEVGTEWIIGEWTEADVPQVYIDLMKKLPPPEARKLLRTIAMMGDRYQ